MTMFRNHRSFASLLAIGVMLLSLMACKSSSPKLEDAIPNPIPESSKFSKIALGWSMGRVHDTIGMPNDTRNYMTGKAFIPMYFGSDRARMEDLYKGEGRIIYAGGTGLGNQGFTVFKIIYDPNESGYNDAVSQ